jgi:hypothetical protein
MTTLRDTIGWLLREICMRSGIWKKTTYASIVGISGIDSTFRGYGPEEVVTVLKRNLNFSQLSF